MTDLIRQILEIILGAGGLAGLLSLFLYRKESKNLKKTEVKDKELDVLAKQTEYYESKLTAKDARIDELYREVRELITANNKLTNENEVLKIRECRKRGCVDREPKSEY